MELLSNEIKIQILNYIPRKVHPVSILFKDELKRGRYRFISLFEGDYCECCGEPIHELAIFCSDKCNSNGVIERSDPYGTKYYPYEYCCPYTRNNLIK